MATFEAMSASANIYLDHNATTACDERVVQAMLPFFSAHFGNAASHTHAHGWFAQGAVEKARGQVAALIGAEPSEIVFTSGATESLNTALKGIAAAYRTKGNHIITCKTEHRAVLDTCEYLESAGMTVTYLDVDFEGRIDVDALERAFTDQTVLVCIMAANNETGVLQDLQAIAEITHRHGALMMSDTTQLVGKLSLDVNEAGLDVCCLSAHKLYGPKGVGALYLRRRGPRVSMLPLLHGGGHEQGRRSGTLNVPGIVALGEACDIAGREMWDNSAHISRLKNYFEHQLLDIEGLRINGSTRHRLYNTSNLCFPALAGHASLLSKQPDVSFSAGSACTSASAAPSHVLAAMGLPAPDIKQSYRFSFGRTNTMKEVETVVAELKILFAPQA